jgi:hypothetical protein
MKEKLATKMDYDEFLGWAITLVVERFLEDGLKGIHSFLILISSFHQKPHSS